MKDIKFQIHINIQRRERERVRAGNAKGQYSLVRGTEKTIEEPISREKYRGSYSERY